MKLTNNKYIKYIFFNPYSLMMQNNKSYNLKNNKLNHIVSKVIN